MSAAESEPFIDGQYESNRFHHSLPPNHDIYDSVKSSSHTQTESSLSHRSSRSDVDSVEQQDDPYEYQLTHPSPRTHLFIRQHLQPIEHATTAPTAQNVVSSESSRRFDPEAATFQPSQPLAFLPSSSTTGYTLSSLPMASIAEKNHPVSQAANKQYIKYMQLGFLEITDALLSSICPADLRGVECPHDSVFEWNWINDCWELCLGGCGMLRLCEQLHCNPPIPPPPFSFPILITSPHLISHFQPTRTPNRDMVITHIFAKPPGPHLRPTPPSLLPPSHHHHALHCANLHTINHTCSSLHRNANPNLHIQTCSYVTRGEICPFGHDLQSARIDSLKALGGHKEEARRKRARPGVVFVDKWRRWCWERRGPVWRVEEERLERVEEGSG